MRAQHQVIPALTFRTTPYGERAKVFCGDANALIGDMLALVPETAPTFAFLDPEGSELRGPPWRPSPTTSATSPSTRSSS